MVLDRGVSSGVSTKSLRKYLYYLWAGEMSEGRDTIRIHKELVELGCDEPGNIEPKHGKEQVHAQEASQIDAIHGSHRSSSISCEKKRPWAHKQRKMRERCR